MCFQLLCTTNHICFSLTQKSHSMLGLILDISHMNVHFTAKGALIWCITWCCSRISAWIVWMAAYAPNVVPAVFLFFSSLIYLKFMSQFKFLCALSWSYFTLGCSLDLKSLLFFLCLHSTINVSVILPWIFHQQWSLAIWHIYNPLNNTTTWIQTCWSLLQMEWLVMSGMVLVLS